MKDGKVFIIAEIGVNHNGNFDLAKKLVDAAANAGANAVKFQIFKTEHLVANNTQKPSYQLRDPSRNQYEMLKKFELSYDEFEELRDYSEKKGIEFIATPYDLDSVDFLEKLGVDRYKIASADIVYKRLLEKVAKTQKQIILSTGMASLGEIERAIKLIRSAGNDDIVLMHCVSEYPTPYEHVNMNVMLTLKHAFDLPVGYSDHTLGIEIPIMAVSLGAIMIEKHLTLDRTLPGPDHFISLEPKQFKEMVLAIRHVEKAFGSVRKELSHGEMENIKFMRRSIHAAVDIKRGDVITKNKIKIVRPYDGIDPWFEEIILGKTVNRDIKEGDPITWGDIL